MVGLMEGFFLGGVAKGQAQLVQEDQSQQRIDIAHGHLVEKQKGTLIKQDYLKIAQADLGLRIDDHQMKREKFSWMKEDRMRLKEKQEGMMAAADKGGYYGVIEYLKGIDPVQAINIHAGKLKLDASIMRNDVMKYTAEAQKAKAMEEGYSVLGRMGAAILKVKPEERQQAYSQMMPMIKKVNPNATGDLGQDAGMLMTASALSTPQGLIYGDNTKSKSLGNQIVNMEAQLDVLRQQGKLGSPEGRARMIDYKQLQAEQQKVLLQDVQRRGKIAQTDEKRVSHHNDEIRKLSKPYAQFQEINTILQPLFNSWETNKDNPQLSTLIGAKMAKWAAGVGTVSEVEFARGAKTDSFLKRWFTYAKGVKEGTKIEISNAEVKRMHEVYLAAKEGAENTQAGVESGYNAALGPLDPAIKSKLVYPSQLQRRSELLGTYPSLKGIPEDVQQDALDMMMKHNTPEAHAKVINMIPNILKSRGQ